MPLLTKFKKTHFHITIPIKGYSSFIYCKAWIHESDSVKIIYLDGTESLICSRALMIANISVVNMDPESGNLMERLYSHKPQNSHPVIRLYKQECNYCTCLEFKWIIAFKHMHMCDLSSDAPDPAQSSVVWYTKVVTQNIKISPKCQKNQCWKQLKTV